MSAGLNINRSQSVGRCAATFNILRCCFYFISGKQCPLYKCLMCIPGIGIHNNTLLWVRGLMLWYSAWAIWERDKIKQMINSLAGAVTLHRSHKLLRASRGHILSDGAVGENETEATLCVLWCCVWMMSGNRRNTASKWQQWVCATRWLRSDAAPTLKRHQDFLR